jgi:hypothetical protein
MDEKDALKTFLEAAPVIALADRVQQDQGNPRGKGTPHSQADARRSTTRVQVTAASLVAKASRLKFGKTNCLTEGQVLPVDKFLLSQYCVRKKIPGDGWCYARALLEHQKTEDPRVSRKFPSPEFETKEEVMNAIADELFEHWEHYAQFMDTSYSLLTDNDQIMTACNGVRKGVWNQAIGDAVPIAGGKVKNRKQRFFSNNYMQDIYFRDMDLESDVPVWKMVNVGDHWDVAVDVSKTTTITEIIDQFLPLYEQVSATDVDIVVAEVARHHFPEQFTHGAQRWFSVRMRDGTFRTADFATLNEAPRLSKMMTEIMKLESIVEVADRCFEQKGESHEVFYLCILQQDKGSVRRELYVSRQVLARNAVADQLVRTYDAEHLMPIAKAYVIPDSLSKGVAALWRDRVRWEGPRTMLPADCPMHTSGSAESDFDVDADAPEVGSMDMQPSSAAAATDNPNSFMRRPLPKFTPGPKESKAYNAALQAQACPVSPAAASVQDEKVVHPGAEGAAPASEDVCQTQLTISEYQAMTDTALMAATEAQQAAENARAQTEATQIALATARAQNEELALMLANFKKAQTQEAQRREREREEENQQKLEVRLMRERERACAHCGLTGTPTSQTTACSVQLCSNWTHTVVPCGVADSKGYVTCAACFTKSCAGEYLSQPLAGTLGGDLDESAQSALDDRGSDGSGSAEPAKPRAAKYTFTGVIKTPNSSDTWFAGLQLRKRALIRQGAITADGVQLHAFASHKLNTPGSKKFFNIAMVTPVISDLEQTAVSVMLSWLNLDSEKMDFSKCDKYTMPRNVKDAINSTTFPRPKQNPFPLPLKKDSARSVKTEKGGKRKNGKSVLSEDDGEGESDSECESSAHPFPKKRAKDTTEIRELRKKLDEALAAAAAAAATSKGNTSKAVESKLQPSVLDLAVLILT